MDQAAKFHFFETVDEAYEAMLGAIESARVSLRLEVYIYRASPIGERFRDALVRACGRGVKTQVLVDALGSISLPDKFWEPLVQAGGGFRWFNPLKFKRLSFRDHRKMLVIDEEFAFVGGFNISPEYQGDGVTRGWHDTGMRVPQALAQELAASFDLSYALADYRHRRFTRLRRSAIQGSASTPDGQLLTTAPGRGPLFLGKALLADMNRARRIDLISAYFLPTRQLRRALARAAKRGCQVRLILAGKSDVLLSQLAARRLYQGLMKAGVEIHEYQPQILHTKLFIFDDTVYVGSANLDKRSLVINYELMVRLQQPQIAAAARRFFGRTLSHCRKIEPAAWRASRTLWTKLREQWAFFALSKVDPYLTQIQLRLLLRERKQFAASRDIIPPGD